MFGVNVVGRHIRNTRLPHPQLSPPPGSERRSTSEERDRESGTTSLRKRQEFRIFGAPARGGAVSGDVLPSAGELVHAIRRNGEVDHPMARWASELAELYERTDAEPERHCAKERRVDVVHHIDSWMERHVPQHRNGAVLHTETLGSVVARIAAASVEADKTLANLRPGDPTVHAAWCRLAELLDAYTDLITEVLTGRRRLPTFASVQ
ncbi:DUF4254 domain-containing protein [Nocardia sp. NPDC004168]|uniref:DUF4254 domain-containing protein n=1 Tax=Nocardia sp. NPDC004168 TaxID=3154452 RepID=UPI0033B7DA30